MKIAIVGDLVLRTPKQTYLGSNLQKILNSSDIRILNFESPLESKKSLPIRKSGANLTQDQEAPLWVKEHGFNLVSIANNHILDSGAQTFHETAQVFTSINIPTIGAGTITEAYRVHTVHIGNKKIGFIAGTHKEFGCHNEISTIDIGASWILSQHFARSLIQACATHDKVFVIAHGGVELLNIPLPEWRAIYKGFIDMGAAGVIASHPHVPQGWEIYKERPIAYSLGNFIFQKKTNKFPPFWNNGLIAVIDVNFTNGQSTFHLQPTIYDNNKGIVDIDDTDVASQHLEKLNLFLSDDELYKKELSESMKRIAPIYQEMYASAGYYRPNVSFKFLRLALRSILKGRPDNIRAYNLFNCESHKWVMERLLRENLL